MYMYEPCGRWARSEGRLIWSRSWHLQAFEWFCLFGNLNERSYSLNTAHCGFLNCQPLDWLQWMVRFVSELKVNMSTLYKDRTRKREQLTLRTQRRRTECEREREGEQLTLRTLYIPPIDLAGRSCWAHPSSVGTAGARLRLSIVFRQVSLFVAPRGRRCPERRCDLGADGGAFSEPAGPHDVFWLIQRYISSDPRATSAVVL